jgi:hypothetical protein
MSGSVGVARVLCSGTVTQPASSGWWTRPKWLKAIGYWAGGVAERLAKDQSPESRLQQLEGLLVRLIRRHGPDGGPVANGRTAVAIQLEMMGRSTEARLLREQTLASYRQHRGDEDPNTLIAEEGLAVNLTNSGLREKATPLVAHLCEASANAWT